MIARNRELVDALSLERHLTNVGGDRERPACPRRGRGRQCAPAALDERFWAAPQLDR